jgi:hypothetical protein
LRLQTLPAPCHRREPAASSLLGPALSLTLVLLLPLPHHRCPGRVCGVSTATASAPPRALVIGEACDRRLATTHHTPVSLPRPRPVRSAHQTARWPHRYCSAVHVASTSTRYIHAKACSCDDASSTRAAPAEAPRRTRAVSAAPCIAAHSLRILVHRHPTPRRLMLESKVA